ncbi:hypothetical protein, partial [Roseateles sp.]|uniref:hypothetical protein n=1 Tax=Roseateles sp. TaxID=1971397 RepID=UPI002F423A28
VGPVVAQAVSSSAAAAMAVSWIVSLWIMDRCGRESVRNRPDRVEKAGVAVVATPGPGEAGNVRGPGPRVNAH